MKLYEMKDYIIDHIPQPALYEALAEEATELAQASLKMARILRGENPTPVTEREALKNLREEYGDVMNVIYMLDIYQDVIGKDEKLYRWVERIRDKKEMK